MHAHQPDPDGVSAQIDLIGVPWLNIGFEPSAAPNGGDGRGRQWVAGTPCDRLVGVGPHDRCRGGSLAGGKPVARILAACQPGSPHPCHRRPRLADAR
jgi:hypothetical protein